MSLNCKDLLKGNTVIAAKSERLEGPLYEFHKVQKKWETITPLIYFPVSFPNDKVALKPGRLKSVVKGMTGHTLQNL